MTMDLENTISLISSSTKKPSYDSDSIESVTTKEINDAAADLIYNESTREITNTKDACLSSCLINTDYDKGPKCPRKGETISLCESRSNKSSKDIDSDEEDHPDDKWASKHDQRPTKRLKSTKLLVGQAFNMPPNLLSAPQPSSQQIGQIIS